MGLGDPADALRAKTELARRHAREQQVQAREQRARALVVREAEERAAARARLAARIPDSGALCCDRCHTVWRAEVIREATRRKAVCLMCGGPLRPASAD